MKFIMVHDIFNTVEIFTEETAPDWLTGDKTIVDSTMDRRWFWNDYVLSLPIGGSVETDFNKIIRVE